MFRSPRTSTRLTGCNGTLGGTAAVVRCPHHAMTGDAVVRCCLLAIASASASVKIRDHDQRRRDGPVRVGWALHHDSGPDGEVIRGQ